jgi:hypothetical protein
VFSVGKTCIVIKKDMIVERISVDFVSLI